MVRTHRFPSRPTGTDGREQQQADESATDESIRRDTRIRNTIQRMSRQSVENKGRRMGRLKQLFKRGKRSSANQPASSQSTASSSSVLFDTISFTNSQSGKAEHSLQPTQSTQSEQGYLGHLLYMSNRMAKDMTTREFWHKVFIPDSCHSENATGTLGLSCFGTDIFEKNCMALQLNSSAQDKSLEATRDGGSVVCQLDEEGIELLNATVPERSTWNLLEKVATRDEEPQPQASEQYLSLRKDHGFSMFGEGEEEGIEITATAPERSARKGNKEQEERARHGAEQESAQKGKITKQDHESQPQGSGQHDSLLNSYGLSMFGEREEGGDINATVPERSTRKQRFIKRDAWQDNDSPPQATEQHTSLLNGYGSSMFGEREQAQESTHDGMLDEREEEGENARNRSIQDDMRDYYDPSGLETSYDEDDNTFALAVQKGKHVVLRSKHGGKFSLTPWCLFSMDCETIVSV